jgi:hypothetical protein
MQRRGGSGQPMKGERTQPKARKAPNAALIAGLQEQLDQRTRALEEALEQQAASAEILRVISHPSFDLQTVFDTIAVNAVRLCHAHMGAVHRFDGRLIHIVAHHNFPPEAVEVLRRMYPRPPQPDQASGRAILTREWRRLRTCWLIGNTRARLRSPVSGEASSQFRCYATALLSEQSPMRSSFPM